MAIEREKERLGRENGDLRSILKQYLDGISVNEDVINAPNPLLVVNHKTNIVMPTSQQRMPVSTTVRAGCAHARAHACTRAQAHLGHARFLAIWLA
eukprot:767453-Pleurochrysis_carterae.AAC.1